MGGGTVHTPLGDLSVQLTFFQLSQRFAVDTLSSCGSRLQPSYANFDATRFTKTIVIVIDELKGFFNFTNELSFPVSCT